ncbi:MAG: prolipoprotein diacylglyceryl transferase [Chitinispirillaceae bacterium]|jgi:phosphatidylglycerol:prolipoprotein diacylglycerol transferase
MHPILFRIFGFPIHSYGVMLALSFLVGIWLADRRAKKAGLNPDAVNEMAFFLIISALIGARLYYAILHWEEFRNSPLDVINPFAGGTIGMGGLVMYGGFIGAILSGIVFFKVKKLPFLPYADVCSASVGIGIFFTRIGCFLNGCCYGAPAAHGVVFPADSPAGAYQTAMHVCALYPSQLYEATGGLFLTALVLLSSKRFKFSGAQFYIMGVGYAVLRFLVDFTRFYSPAERLGPFSHNQIVCIGLFITLSVLFVKGFHALKQAS